MDSAICQKKQNLVAHFLLGCWGDIAHKLLQERSKKSWSTKTNLWECLTICRNNSLNCLDLWVTHISIDWEAMTNSISPHVSWNTTKSENWEWSVCIIWLYYITYITDCWFVLVVCSKIMKGGRWWWISVWCGIVDCTNNWDTPTTS